MMGCAARLSGFVVFRGVWGGAAPPVAGQGFKARAIVARLRILILQKKRGKRDSIRLVFQKKSCNMKHQTEQKFSLLIYDCGS